MLAATTKELGVVKRMVDNGRVKDAEKIGVRVARVINKYSMAKLFVLDIQANHFAFQVDEQSVKRQHLMAST